MSELSAVQEIAIVAAPALAALAAGASWAAVRQSAATAREAREPDLSIQPIINPMTGGVGAMVHNAGGGSARGVTYVIADGTHAAFGYIGHGLLRPDELVEIKTNFGASTHEPDSTLAMVSCRDRRGNAHAWTHTEQHLKLTGRFGRKPEYGPVLDKFREAFPGVDPEQLTRGDADVGKPER